MRKTRWTFVGAFALFAGALVLGGCAGSPPPEPRAEVRRIAVIPIVPPERLYIENRSMALLLFPLPTLVAESIANRRKSTLFTEKLENTRAQLGATLTTELLHALRAEGYEASVVLNVKRPHDDPDGVDYKSLDTEEGAVLRVGFNAVGMHSSRLSNDYQPRVNVWASLLARPDPDASRAEDNFYYGADAARTPDAWNIPAAAKYRYPTFDALIDKADEVGEGYEIALRALARHIAEQLRAQL
ncbi:hypothetical protein [Variovorax saccharolyticus]|uniref:hypothetical protein n=1 Tax=Variovorax saccharolyticus TaxID=3053516 RepID=UPI0025785AF1|nr:hypothetical protein [Variovorax sp. J31P216]MDM0029783.1 hypothetical protein [Variovorax sp. J31P216]